MLSACDLIGQTDYERLRARAMLSIQLNCGLRVSDIATLERSSIDDGKLYIHAQKNKMRVMRPLPDDLVALLASLPLPKGAGPDCSYFYWSGNSTRRTAVRNTERTLKAVYKRSSVAGARTHRFRHTLATRILEAGYTEQDVADVLGDSLQVVQKHYVHWTKARQLRIERMIHEVQGSGTKLVQADDSVTI